MQNEVVVAQFKLLIPWCLPEEKNENPHCTVLTEIRTDHFPDTGQNRYQLRWLVHFSYHGDSGSISYLVIWDL
jgi:hypothetical protein